MTHVEEINTMAELSGLAATWSRLHAMTEGATFFQTLAWLQVYWRHLAENQRLRVLVVYEGDEVTGIVPLVVRTEQTRLGAIRVLTYPLQDWGSFYGPLGARPGEVLKAALAHVHDSPRDWDVLDLRWVDRDHVDRGQTVDAMHEAGLNNVVERAWAPVAVVDLRGDWDSYFASRSAKRRSNLRRCRRLLDERGKVRFVRYRPAGSEHGDDDPRSDLYEACEQIAQRSWQGDSTTGTTMTHESVRAFLRDAHVAAVEAGAVDVCLLYVDEEPVAFVYNYRVGGRLFGLRMGFDPAVDGAGAVLMQEMLQDSFARGDEWLDLGAGYLECKRPWLTSVAASYSYTHYAPRDVRAQALRWKRWLAARLSTKPALQDGLKQAG